MQDNLPELRDIHLPAEDISVFPLAYGWWVLAAAVIILVLVIRLLRLLWRKSRRRYALRLLDNARRPELSSAVKMSEILRRICVYKYPAAAALFGKDWLDFLNNRAKSKISGRAAQLLLDAPYIGADSKVYGREEIDALYLFCRGWIGENL